MVEVQIRTLDPGGTESAWRTAATLRVEDGHLELDGDERLVDLEHPAPDRRAYLRTGERRRIYCRDDPEEWARNLPATYRGPYLVAAVVRDTNPLPAPERQERRRIEIPEPAADMAARGR